MEDPFEDISLNGEYLWSGTTRRQKSGDTPTSGSHIVAEATRQLGMAFTSGLWGFEYNLWPETSPDTLSDRIGQIWRHVVQNKDSGFIDDTTPNTPCPIDARKVACPLY
jgi:hypothetical protein